jgi:hypothetical protein
VLRCPAALTWFQAQGQACGLALPEPLRVLSGEQQVIDSMHRKPGDEPFEFCRLSTHADMDACRCWPALPLDMQRAADSEVETQRARTACRHFLELPNDEVAAAQLAAHQGRKTVGGIALQALSHQVSSRSAVATCAL